MLKPEEPYFGSHPLYRRVTEANSGDKGGLPIYVGKAIPAGARRGGGSVKPEVVGTVLYNRLLEHAESIKQTMNLKVDDFRCRYLVVEDIWIPLGESLLIEKFWPVWNVVIDGYGNHDPGKGRYQQKCSPWDVLHPGRPWASRLQPALRNLEELTALIQAHFKKTRP